MAYETILYSVEEEVATLTLNRPEVQNGFNIQVCDEIMAAIEEARGRCICEVLGYQC